MSETVIREVAKGVWTFSRPFARFGFVPVGGRSTAIKLQDGGVWVLASTALDEETKSAIKKLGPVQYIIGADAVHYLFIDRYKTEYPTAKVIAPLAAVENVKKAGKDVSFHGVWGRDPPDTRYGFENEIEHCYFSGFRNKDVAFFHKDSKSLIQADLLVNLPAQEQYSRAKKPSPILSAVTQVSPSLWIYPHVIGTMGDNKEAMRHDAKKVADWDFQRIIPCHGDVVESGAKAAWNTVYRKFLN